MGRISFGALAGIILFTSSTESYAPTALPRHVARFGSRQLRKQQHVVKLKMLAPSTMEGAATLLSTFALIHSEVHSIWTSSTMSIADAVSANPADMFALPEAVYPSGGDGFLDIESLPPEVAVPLDDFMRERHEEFSYMDIMAKVPLAASILAVCDFALNRLLVDDVEENLRQEEMDGDIEAENKYFWTQTGTRFGALIAVSLATVVISKVTYDNPF